MNDKITHRGTNRQRTLHVSYQVQQYMVLAHLNIEFFASHRGRGRGDRKPASSDSPHSRAPDIPLFHSKGGFGDRYLPLSRPSPQLQRRHHPALHVKQQRGPPTSGGQQDGQNSTIRCCGGPAALARLSCHHIGAVTS